MSIITPNTTGQLASVRNAPEGVSDESRNSILQQISHKSRDPRLARILVIDDEPVVGQVLQKALIDAGFSNPQVLTDSTQAIAHIASSEPDLVILDVQMPNVNGLDILKHLRESESYARLPILIFTSLEDEATRLRALELGATEFLQKPLCAAEITLRVRNVLQTKLYQEQLELDALKDGLTGLPNNRAFEFELRRRVAEWRRKRTPFACIELEIDDYDQFTQRFGSVAGDMAYKEFTSRLIAATREIDLVARLEGRRFGILLPACHPEAAIKACVRVHKEITNTEFNTGEEKIALTASFGLAAVEDLDDAELIQNRVGSALHSARQNGPNSCVRHEAGQFVQVSLSSLEMAVQPRTNGGDIRASKIAIIDDEIANIAIAQKHLKDDGFTRFITVSDSTKAVSTIKMEDPDLILLDLRMPIFTGWDILEELRKTDRLENTPVIVLTATQEKQAKIDSLELGASDYLEKPIEARELLARVHNTLLAKMHLDVLQNSSERLEYEVQLRTTELQAARREAVQCLARAAELRDDVTGKHVLRVGRYAALIAEELGFNEERMLCMEHAAQLHDVGKIGISDSILHKPGRLTEEEFEIMKGHCVAGRSIIRDEVISDDKVLHKNVFNNWTSPMMQLASVVAATHHEQWDGSGYPQGLKGEEIPIEGRITAVADVFDALSSKRPYKAAIPLDDCFLILESKRGTHFDPRVLDAFIKRRSEVESIAREFSD